jgi:hypothetical protein
VAVLWTAAREATKLGLDVSELIEVIVTRGFDLLTAVAPVTEAFVYFEGDGWKVDYADGVTTNYAAADLNLPWAKLLAQASVTLDRLARDRGVNLKAYGGGWQLVVDGQMTNYADTEAVELYDTLLALPEPAEALPERHDRHDRDGRDVTDLPGLWSETDRVTADPAAPAPREVIEGEDGAVLVEIDTQGLSPLAGEALAQLTAALRNLLRNEALLVDVTLLTELVARMGVEGGADTAILAPLLDQVATDADWYAEREGRVQ